MVVEDLVLGASERESVPLGAGGRGGMTQRDMAARLLTLPCWRAPRGTHMTRDDL